MDISKTLKSFIPHLVGAKMAFDASKYEASLIICYEQKIN